MQIDQENEERKPQEAFETYNSREVKVENWSKSNSKIRTTEPQPKITGSYKKKCTARGVDGARKGS